jgi:hypothetical protein
MPVWRFVGPQSQGFDVHEVKLDGRYRDGGDEIAVRLAIFNLPFSGRESHWLQRYLNAIRFWAKIDHDDFV